MCAGRSRVCICRMQTYIPVSIHNLDLVISVACEMTPNYEALHSEVSMMQLSVSVNDGWYNAWPCPVL